MGQTNNNNKPYQSKIISESNKKIIEQNKILSDQGKEVSPGAGITRSFLEERLKMVGD